MNLMETIKQMNAAQEEELIEAKVGKMMKVKNPHDDRHGQSGKVVSGTKDAYVLQFKDGKRGSFSHDELSEEVELEEKKLDDVDKGELKKDFDDRKDQDIDNDGDTDSSDEYLHKRRKAVSKAIKEKKYGA